MYEQRGTYVCRKHHCDHRDRGSWATTKSSNVHRVVYSFRLVKLTTPRTIIKCANTNKLDRQKMWVTVRGSSYRPKHSKWCMCISYDTYKTSSARGRYHFNLSLLQTMSVFNIIKLNMLGFRLTENMKVVFSFVTLLLWFGRVDMQPSSRKYQLWVTGDATRC